MFTPLLGFCVCAALATLGASLGAKETVVSNFSANSLYTVDLTTGDRTVVSSSTVGTGAPLASPLGIAQDASGALIVANRGTKSLMRVDPVTGNRTVVSSSTVGTGTSFSDPWAVAIESDGHILVGDQGSGFNLYRVDPATGDRQVLAANFASITGILVDTNTIIVVNIGNTGTESLIKVDPTTGAQTQLSSGGLFARPSFAVKRPNGHYLVTNSSSGSVVDVDPTTGAQTLVSGTGQGTGDSIDESFGVSITADGQIFVLSFSSNAIYLVDGTTGDRTVASSSTVGTGPAFSGPLSILGAAVDSIGNSTPAPVVTAVSPASGPTAGGTSITITGTGFTGATAVTFGSNTPAVSFTGNGDTTIYATATAGSAGVVDITVTTPSGTSSASTADQYTYVAAPTVTALSPTAGPLGGGTSVTLTGTDFTNVTAVSFGSNAAASFTTNGPTQLIATAPAESAGVVDVTVTAVGGTSTTVPADHYTYVAAPTVTSVATTDGPLSGGAQVVLTGTGFTNATSVSFGGLAATSFTVVNDATIDATAPATTTTGVVDITVTTVGGTSGTSGNDHFNYLAVPAVTEVSPIRGPLGAGTSVTITGTAFTGATAVAFGVNAPAVSYTVNSDTTIIATAPAGSAGVVDVTVTTDGGTSTTSGADHYQYVALPTVSGLSPTAGPLGGGTSITLTGTNFIGVTRVSFGSNTPATFTVNSPTRIFATAPAESAGLVDVTVTAAGGTSTTSAADQYTYVAAPTVTSVTTTDGPLGGGAQVVLTGTGFTNASSVSFGGLAATSFTVVNDTTIDATAPATTTTGVVDITVTTVGGTSGTGAGDHFDYLAAPTVTQVSPIRGPLGAGTSVTITGTAFTGATAVAFGANTPAVSYTVNSDTTIIATAPAGSAGVVDVTVTTDGGTSATSSADHYLYVAPPTVSGLSPTAGPLGGGTSITLTGTNFIGVTGVSFGANTPASFTVNSPTTIFATAPAESAGVVDVTVTAVGGTSTTNAADQYTYVAAPTVTSVTTTDGPLSGGAQVVLTGTGFTNASSVSFGGLAATSFTVVNDTTIDATAPSTTTVGVVDITVTTVGGTSSTSANDHFNYLAIPTVTQVSPIDGPTSGGTNITITGSAFTSVTGVSFGANTPATFTVNSPTTIFATAPAGSAGVVDVTVTTDGGTSATGSSDHYAYVALPTVTAVSPAAGALAGGNTVTITGTAFTTTTGVTFGTNAPASFTVNSPTTIFATAPAGSAGVVDVTVTTDGGTSATGTADQYDYVSAPTVSGLSVNGGPLAGSTTITLSGTNFVGVTAVDFGGTAATSFTVNSPTLITAVAPAESAGSVDVTVIAAGGTSTTGSSDHYSYEAAPSFTSGSSAVGTFGISGAVYQAAAINSPTFSIVSGSLPPGLTLDSASGIISGTPTQAGNYSVTIGAINLGGSASLNLGIVIQQATASIALSGLTATYDGTAKTVTATTTPPGLGVTITYGGLSTAPTEVGSYTVVATISDANYSGSQTGTLVISSPPVTTARQFFGSFTLTTGSSVSTAPRPAAALTGSIAATVNATSTSGTIIGSVGNSAFVVGISIGSNGAFSGSTTALTVPGSTVTGTLTFTGTLSGNTLSGTIAPLGVSFSMPADATGGTSAPLAGYYQASSLDSATGSTYSIVGPQGDVLVVSVTPTAVVSGSGTVAANGNIAVTTTSGATITGNVNAPTTTVTLNITSGGITTTYSGVASTTARTDRLINLSSRGSVTGGNMLVSGLVIGGSANKTVLLRAVGPGLAAFNLTGVLAQPHLQLFNAAGQVISDSTAWNNTGGLPTVFAQVGAFPLVAGSTDAAVEMSLAPGVYTLQVSNAGTDAGGLALAEIYDASANPTMEYQRLINISTRAFVSSGAANLTGGFVITGNNPKQVLIRGVGPGLAAFGIGNTLSDPFLTVFNSAGTVIAENDNWGTPIAVTAGQTVAAASDITAADLMTGAFALTAGSKDAALIVTLPPGAYTAQVTGVGGVTGTALVEIYEIPQQ